MDHFHLTLKQIRRYVLAWMLLENVVVVASFWALSRYSSLPLWLDAAACLLAAVVLALLCSSKVTAVATQPLKALWQLVLHLSPDTQSVAAPDMKQLKIGHELVANLAGQINQLITVADGIAVAARRESYDLHKNFIANSLPLPLIVLDKEETIVYANEAAAAYIGQSSDEMAGKNVYMVLDMSFPSIDTFDTWLRQAKQNVATATGSWERVRLNVRDNHPTRLFDLASYYNKDNGTGNETMLVLFDHTKQYSQDEQAVSFIALSVHELRTPLTLLRGYIEVFEEEMATTQNPELASFMEKMSATAQQLMAFVNNILNVARVDADQMQMELHEEDWNKVLTTAIANIGLRAKVRGITLECTIAPGLPPVAIDRLSLFEVINNLVDNAIKYSGKSQIIKVDAHLTKDNMVETTVQDFGLGISGSVMPNLFTKFYRDHRNRAQIGGTGLGLYLSKAIVTAHGGHLWVQSKEGEGSTFGFTIQPFANLAAEGKRDNQEIVRGAHGWIKNHSMYRR
ncbi:MAG: hypothetical protein JWN38_1124 [Candidatus Saccharibacteria bacterium]|nr:hypothetical protein [Candidatus Saccharibacteria bacterium]